MGWINIEIQSGNDLVMLPNAMASSSAFCAGVGRLKTWTQR